MFVINMLLKIEVWNVRKINRIVGQLIYDLFAKHLPTSFYPIQIGQTKIRAFCAKLILAECGENVNVEKGASFSGRVHLGNNSGIGINASIGGTCYIGNDVMMGPQCIIYTRNHKTDDVTTTMRGQGFCEEKPVIIGDDVWIGGRVIILPGVSIGSHSIIGAGSVVTKNVPEWAVVAGNPAIVKKFRK